MCLWFPGKHCYVPVISWKTLLCACDFLENIVMCLWFLGKHWYVPMISWKALLCACDFLENIVCLWYDTRDSAPSLLPQKENKSKTAQGGLWVFFIRFLVAPKQTLDYWHGENLLHQIIITTLFQFWPVGHWKPCKKVGPQSPTGCPTFMIF